MAEFSKEYLEQNGNDDWQSDFSIMEIYKDMKEGELVQRICEGFGFFGIKKVNNNCILVYRDSEVLIEEILN